MKVVFYDRSQNRLGSRDYPNETPNIGDHVMLSGVQVKVTMRVWPETPTYLILMVER